MFNPQSAIRNPKFYIVATLGVIVCGAAFAPRLRAQAQTPSPPGDVAKQFMFLLDIIGSPALQQKFNTNADVAKFEDLISQKSRKDLGDRGLGPLLEELSNERMTTHWKANDPVTLLDPKTVIAEVQPDPVPGPRSIVLVQEGGEWRVDVVETFARWNDLKGDDKLKRVYEITKIVLPGMPVSNEIMDTQCMGNMKQIGLAMMAYEQDYDDKYPSAKQWSDALYPYSRSKEILNCPAIAGGQNGYAMNWKLSAKTADAVKNSAAMVQFYESSVLIPNQRGQGNDLTYRHTLNLVDGANYEFVDGHVKWFPRNQPQDFAFGSAPAPPPVTRMGTSASAPIKMAAPAPSGAAASSKGPAPSSKSAPAPTHAPASTPMPAPAHAATPIPSATQTPSATPPKH